MTMKQRANYVAAPAMFDLHNACVVIQQAFPNGGVYLVGSALERRDHRDVDVRCILPDEEFDALFPNAPAGPAHWNARWSLMSVTISHWLRQQTGLPIDFQFQKQSLANARHNGPRSALGLWVSHGDARA
jgi:hypothetical protein